MGKSCVRIKTLDDIPLEVLGKAVKRMTAKKFIKEYEPTIGGSSKKAATKKAVTKKPATKRRKTPVRKS